jgi:alpha-tubulin suppressor-like RCC1 family protein
MGFGAGGNWLNILRWTPVPGLAGIVDVASGSKHSLALDSDGRVWATGDLQGSGVSSFGWQPQTAFAPIPGLTGVRSIAAGAFCSMAVKRDGTLWVAGSAGPALGLGSSAGWSTATWRQVPNVGNVVAVATDCGKTLLIKGDGTLWVAGDNTWGQIGLGNPAATPSAPRQVSTFTWIDSWLGF